MSRGWIVGVALIMVAVPGLPAAAAGVAMVLKGMAEPDALLRGIRTGDVLRYEVRLKGMGADARPAVAAASRWHGGPGAAPAAGAPACF